LLLKIHWLQKSIEVDTIEKDIAKLTMTDEENHTQYEEVDQLLEKKLKISTSEVQSVRMFDIVKVKIAPQLNISPPQIKLFGVYPIKEKKADYVVIQDVIMKKEYARDMKLDQGLASCPGMADDRD
jgi:hypothetical protein